MQSLVRFSVRNLAAVLLLAGLLIAGGVYTATQLVRELMPKLSFPVVTIVTAYPGGAAEEVDTQITRPIEQILLGLPGVRRIQSKTLAGVSLLSLELSEDVVPADIRTKIQDRLTKIVLPTHAQRPQVDTFGFHSLPIFHLSITSNSQVSYRQLQQLVENDLRPQLERKTGVAAVKIRSESPKALTVVLSPAKLKEKKISVDQVQAALLQAVPAGRQVGTLPSAAAGIPVQLEQQQLESSQLLDLPLALASGDEKGNRSLRLAELARLEEKFLTHAVRTSTQGQPAVNLEITKTEDADITKVIAELHQSLENFQKNHPNLQTHVLFDFAPQVKNSIASIVREGLLGALCAALLILLFLRSLRMTTIVLLSVPLSILSVFLFLPAAHITLNVMTLGGLAVAVGRVVDDSIVVIENIYRRARQAGRWDVPLIAEATREVAPAVTTATVAAVAVFLPLLFVGGAVGKVFFPFAITATLALLLSLVVSLTLIPALTFRFFGRFTVKKGQQRQNGRPATWQRKYQQALRWSLQHPKRVFFASLGLLAGSLFLVPLLGTGFLPAEREQGLEVNIQAPLGTPFEKTVQLADQVAVAVRTLKDVDKVSILAGSLPEESAQEVILGSGGVGGTNRAKLLVKLVESAAVPALREAIETQLAPFRSTAEVSVQEIRGLVPLENSLEIMLTKGTAQGGAMVTRTQLRQAADRVVADLRQNVPGLTDVGHSLVADQPQLTLTLREEAIAQRGLTLQQVRQQLRSQLEGEPILFLPQAVGEPQAVFLRVQQPSVTDTPWEDLLGSLSFSTPTGEKVALSQVATLRWQTGSALVHKEDGVEGVKIMGKVTEKDIGAVREVVQDRLQKLELPETIGVRLAGDVEEMKKSFTQLGLAIAVAVLVVYLVLVVTFGSLTIPLTILFSLPYTIIGGLLGLYITEQTLNVPALIGGLMLIGIVVTNAIVLLDRVLQMQRKGLPAQAAIVEAAQTRLRPILMTALATIGALLPLSLGFGEGTIISRGLAIVVVGGLASSTFLTLFIVPIMHQWLGKGWEKRLVKKSTMKESTHS